MEEGRSMEKQTERSDVVDAVRRSQEILRGFVPE